MLALFYLLLAVFLGGVFYLIYLIFSKKHQSIPKSKKIQLLVIVAIPYAIAGLLGWATKIESLDPDVYNALIQVGVFLMGFVFIAFFAKKKIKVDVTEDTTKE